MFTNYKFMAVQGAVITANPPSLNLACCLFSSLESSICKFIAQTQAPCCVLLLQAAPKDYSLKARAQSERLKQAMAHQAGFPGV